MLFFFLFGKNFARLFLKNKSLSKNSLFMNYDALLVYLGFFWYGNILVLLNFFIPIEYVALFSFLFIFVIEKKSILEFFKLNKFSLIIVGFLLTSIYNNNPSHDANAYHFYIQKLFQNEKINLGISNFESHYGLGSIFDYVSSTLWVGNNYGFIQLINLIFLASFFNFLISSFELRNEFFKNITLSIIIIGLLDNFGFGGGRNGFFFIQEIGKFDSSYAIIFFLCCLLFYIVSLERSYESANFYILLYFLTFLSQIRTMGYLFFIAIFILLFFEKKYFLLLKNKGLILFNSLWVTKSIFSTGCLVYPVSFTCLDILPWESSHQVYSFSKSAVINNRNPNVKNMEIISFNWIEDYWLSENIDYLYNFVLTFLFIFLFFKLFNKNKNKFIKHKTNLIKFNLALFITSWLFLYPNYRFVSGLLVSAYIFFNIDKISNSKLLIGNSKKISLIVTGFLIASASLVVRIDSYKIFMTDFNQDVFSKYEIQSPILEKRVDSYGFKSDEIYCFGQLNCSNSIQKTNKMKIGNYSVYLPINN